MSDATKVTFHCRRVSDGDTYDWPDEARVLEHVAKSNGACVAIRRERTETVIETPIPTEPSKEN